MKFYVIEISTGDSAIAGKAIYEYATQREALAAFHQKLGTAMKSDLYTSDLVMVTDDYGSNIKKEYYAKPEQAEETAE